ncbi:sigma-70 family RNA polymerase sigma factor [Streptomyces akebiae]|uniref:Sigma-70 family RNA polymerase sigma factor n=1 Tax=Streptomyces akebiae TaxID=2865673 RepID=A0ABX8XUV5_9ACTN|nr:sigma-70 family RNA polymerase sigma factor [Streptomyces akebiae]QYX79377.1 sigma-70 family RNA polymerase sigma factor [Streptomyces akebiae]
MTPPSLSRRPGGGAPAGKPGRKLGPIAEGVGRAHRAWLEPLRIRFLASGLTISELSDRSGWAKSKISELLRGTGRYPRWEITYGLLDVLDLPTWPMRRLWMAAALEARKKPDWIDGCIQSRRDQQRPNRPPGPGTALSTGPTVPPLEHRAFTELNRAAYLAYARLFVGEEEAREAVSETFDVLWFRWDEALASSDVVPFAWSVLRASVMARARHTDGHPELTRTAFDTVALSLLSTPTARFAQIEESMALFRAISRLPAHQLDVMVLTYLRGMDHAAVADVLGVPIASVHTADRYARKTLSAALHPQNDLGETPE